MRFRAKFALLDWAWVSVAALAALLFFSASRRASQPMRYYAFMMIFFAAIRVLLHLFIFWDVTSDGLRERRLWTARTIPWKEITAVTPWPDSRPNRDYIAIEFVRPAPLSSRGTIIANPQESTAFLSALRRNASHARFEIALRTSPLPA